MNSSEVQALKVGDEVGFGRCGNHGYHSTGFAKVVKVNGHGHVTLDNGRVFDKYGKERGTGILGATLLNADNLRSDLAAKEAQRDKDRKVQNILNLIADRRSGTGHYFIDAETKEQLLALVNEL